LELWLKLKSSIPVRAAVINPQSGWDAVRTAINGIVWSKKSKNERLTRAEAAAPLESTLGYRGLLVEQVGSLARGLPRLFRVFDGRLYGTKLSHRSTDDEFEEFIAGRTGRLKVAKSFEEYLRGEMARAPRSLGPSPPQTPASFPQTPLPLRAAL